jgi:serine/threonine protein kinase
VTEPEPDPWRRQIPGVRLERRLSGPVRTGDARDGVDTFLARCDADGIDVVARLYRRPLRYEHDRHRFTDESQALRRSAVGPNLAPLRDAGITEWSRAYVITEYYPDGSLVDRLAMMGHFTPHEVASLGAKIALALERLHADGLVHRNIKLTNVLFNPFGEPVLADFGFAALATADGDYTAPMPSVPNRFAAPEAFLPELMTPAADVYSLGVLLYALLAGEVDRIEHRTAAPVGDAVSDLRDVPLLLMAALRRAMALDPRERFPAAADLADALSVAV